MAAQYPDYFYFGVVQNSASSVGPTKFYNNAVFPGSTVGCYTEFINFVKQIKDSVTIAGVVTSLLLGGGTIDTYKSDFPALIKKIRSDLGMPNLPFLCNEAPKGAVGYPGSDYVTANQFLDGLADSMTNVVAIPSDFSTDNAKYMLQDGGWHYNLAGQWVFSGLVVDSCKSHGWYPKNTDTQKPSKPTNVLSTTVTSTAITLKWNKSTDNIGILGYAIYKGVDSVGFTHDTTLSISGLSGCTSYAFTIVAHDFSGNHSPSSDPYTTQTQCGADSQSPTKPANLHMVSITPTTISIAWTASTDNIGVTGYDIYDGTTLVKSGVTTTNYTIAGLQPDATLAITIKAKDAAGNVSPASDPLTITTPAYPTIQLPFKLNVAGPAYGGFAADKQWTADGDFGYTTKAVESAATPGVTLDSNSAIYNTTRNGAFAYKIRTPVLGKYTVTLMFAEFSSSAVIGSRVFSALIASAKAAVDPIDIFKAVGMNKPYTVSTPITIDTTLIDIGFTAQKGSPTLSGILVEQAPAYRFNSIKNCAVGDTMLIAWQSNPGLVHNAIICISANSGRSWSEPLNSEGAIQLTDTTWENYRWVVPSQIPSSSGNVMELADSMCMLQIKSYDDEYPSRSNSFLISRTAGIVTPRLPPHRNIVVIKRGMRLLVTIPFSAAYTISVCAINGKAIKRVFGTGPGVIAINGAHFSNGISAVIIQCGDGENRRYLNLWCR
jgi:chitodextrinase